MPAVIERHMKAKTDVQERLAASRAGAEAKVLRTIRCPSCGFHLLSVYGQDHYYIQVKCQKCKFAETIDTALFRTMGKQEMSEVQIRRNDRYRTLPDYGETAAETP